MTVPMQFAGVATVLAVLAAAVPAAGQADTSPEVTVDLNEGIRAYLQGHFDPENYTHYLAAIERFTSVLDKTPRHPTALLFRALSHGQIGLLEREKATGDQDWVTALRGVREVLADPQRRQEIEAQREAIIKTLEEDGEMEVAQRWILESQRDALSLSLPQVERFEREGLEDLEARLKTYEQRVREAADRQREHYTLMTADVQRLVAVLESPEAVLRLLEVIALTKVSRIDEQAALEIMEGERSESPTGLSATELRQAASLNLANAAEVLESQLRTELSGLDAIRTKFFLGVIRFRQAVPRRAPDEGPDRDPDLLRRARGLMAELAAAEQTDRRWRSYAELYLGLITTELGGLETDLDRRKEYFEQARGHLNRAAELDVVREEGREPDSDSGRTVPYVVWRQLDAINRAEGAEPTPQYRHDFQLSVLTGAHQDTNVVLLGGRTDLPRDIPKERDFGFTLGSVLDYTLDMGLLDSRLSRLTLGVQGRVGQLWHVEVDQFDEQAYGGSAALQYTLFPEEEGFGPVHMRLQYDYDYTLLGRDSFVEIQTLTPNLRIYSDDRRATTEFYFSYSLRDYREPLYDRRYNRDGEYLNLGASHRFKTVNMTDLYESHGVEPWGLSGDDALRQDDPDYPARYLTPVLGFIYAWDATRGDEFDQKAYVFTCGVEVPLPYGLMLGTLADFEWQEYAHGSLIDYHRRGRRDFIQRYSVALSRDFVLRGGDLANRYTLDIDRVLLTVRAHATWTVDDSNVVDRLGQAVFEYDRAVYGISFAFTFN